MFRTLTNLQRRYTDMATQLKYSTLHTRLETTKNNNNSLYKELLYKYLFTHNYCLCTNNKKITKERIIIITVKVY